MSSVVLGVRVGTQKTVCIDNTGELLLTESGGVTWPTLLSFDNKLRLFGENALPYFSGDQTFASWNHFLLTDDPATAAAARVFRHRKYDFSKDDATNSLQVSTAGGEPRYAVSIAGMFLSRLKDRAAKVYGADAAMHFAVAVPPAVAVADSAASAAVTAINEAAAQRMREACFVAGFSCTGGSNNGDGEALEHATSPGAATAHMYNSVDCIVAAYTRRVNALRPAERADLVGKRALLFSMGHCSTTAVVVQLGAAHVPAKSPSPPPSSSTSSAATAVTLTATLLSNRFDDSLGAVDFDECLYAHLVATAAAKHPGSKAELLEGGIARGSKRDIRLSLACERARKLLSTLPVAHITVENLTEALGDVNLSVTSKEFEDQSAGLLARLDTLLRQVIASGSMSGAGDESAMEIERTSDVSMVEIFGGGARMPVVQGVLSKIFGSEMPLGAKMEDSSIALGAALLCKKELEAATPTASPSASPAPATATVACLPKSVLVAEHAKELAMQSTDSQTQRLLHERNVLESAILEGRNIPSDRQFGSLVTETARHSLSALVEECENWLYDNAPDSGAADEASPAELLQRTQEKNAELRAKVRELCAAYYEAKAADKAAKEAELEAESKIAEAERAAEGEEEADHDTRKLKKADRMRMVVKNKEEGTELFKGGNYRPAAARYQKALTHASKFFDLSPADEAEVTAVKVSLHSNLAMCYIKLANYDQVIRCCGEAIALDPANAKAYFRRSAAWEAKKEWEKALEDVTKSAELMGEKEDKLVTAAMERIRREMSKIKDKEKKMWGKAFA